jgi:hypothetical protein
MALCLTGCGAFETKMARAWQKLDKADCMRLKVADDLIVDVTAGGMKLPVAISLSGTVDLYLNPVQARADLTLGWPGEELKLLVYVQEEGEAVNVYTNLNGGAVWEKASYTVSKARLSPNGLRYVIEGAETFREVEQPESPFVLRFNEDGNAALFTGDGSKWKLEAVSAIRKYLEEALAGTNVDIIA